MMNYVRRSYFKNTKPQNLLPRMPIRRDKVLKKMMRNRGSIKYIYAPSGYGKSSVAYDYVSYVNNWQEVFWFNCQSACFKRDLKEGCLLDKIFECSEMPNIIVFDDLTELKGKARANFANLVKDLMGYDCDIVVTQNSITYRATPLNVDTTLIFAPDLCVSETEARAAKVYGVYNWFDFQHNNCQCPACLIFSKTGKEDLMLCPISSDTDNLEIATLFFVYLFGSSFYETIYSFLDEEKVRETMPIIASKYPHIGINDEIGSYDTINVDIPLLADAFLSMFDKVVDACKFGSKSNLLDKIMDLMCELEDTKRTYEFVTTFGGIQDIKSFATHEFSIMLKNCDFEFMYDILDKLDNAYNHDDPTISFYKACLFAYVRDKERFKEAVSSFYHGNKELSDFYIPCKLMSYAFMFEKFDDSDLNNIEQEINSGTFGSSKYYDYIALQINKKSCAWLTQYLKTSMTNPSACLEMLGEALLELEIGDNVENKRKSLNVRHENDISGICLAYVYFCLNLLDFAKRGQSFENSLKLYLGESDYERGIRLFEKITKLFVALYDERDNFWNVPWFLIDVLLRMEDIWGVFKETPSCFDNIDIIVVLIAVDSFKESADKLTKAIKRNETAKSRNKDLKSGRGGNFQLCDAGDACEKNRIEISIFNNPNLRINGKDISLSKFSSKKGRFLIALLAIANFREVHRDELIDNLFDVGSSKNRCTLSNFYSIISQLKREFSSYGFDETIIKNPLGYKLNSEIIVTDYIAFDVLVNDFMFNVGCTDSWEEPYSRLKDRFFSPAFSCLVGNNKINSFRLNSNTRLVDALLSAASRLLEQDDTFGALALSRQALELDDRREDVYETLMRSQILAKQRSQAIETFFECKKFLSKELGIAPSKSLVEEYEKLIIQ